MDCKHLDVCLFFNNKMSMKQGLGTIYKKKYCRGNHDQCARYIVAEELGAEKVPENLYPNMYDIGKEIILESRRLKAGKTNEEGISSYIARQPIFDRNMGVYGYELLYRKGNDNFFPQIDDDQATAELLYDSFFVFGLYDLTDGTKAFINFSKELIDSDVPSLLPKQNIIVEILERDAATEATIEACKRIKNLGYSLALDDFVLDQDNIPLLGFADIIKIEYPSVDLDKQASLIKKYGKKIKFVAEKLETREDFSKAFDLGYDLFQGYFFCKPSLIKSKDISSRNINLFNIIQELNKPEPNFSRISTIIQGDLGLSLKLLKLTSSVFFGARNKVSSIRQALSYMGINELYQWISIMILKDYTDVENFELVKMSLVRAKYMELLSLEMYPPRNANEYFFTGMFSFIDVLLNQKMDKVLQGLPLSDNVKAALLGENNPPRRLLNCVIAYEQGNLDEAEEKETIEAIGSEKFVSLYVDAIKWVKELNY